MFLGRRLLASKVAFKPCSSELGCSGVAVEERRVGSEGVRMVEDVGESIGIIEESEF